jgi:general secretion pathway protein J
MKIANDKSQIAGDRNHRSENLFARSGFTLIEIMVAMAIFTIIVGAIYATWVLVLKASRSGEDAAAQIQRERIAVRTIEDSLQCIQSFQGSMAYYSFIVQNGDESVFSFTSRLPGIFPRNGKFGDFDVRRLTFSVEPGADQIKNLVLRQNPILMDMDVDEQSYPLVLARNVKEFVIECWDTNALDWVTEWDDTNSIPTIVRITLSMGGNTDTTKSETTITREIAMASSSVPVGVQTQRAGSGGGGLNLPGGGGINPRNPNGPNQNPNQPSRSTR